MSVGAQILEAVADARGADPAPLEKPLQRQIDVDAIRQLVEHDSTRWSLAFDLAEHTVTVTGDDLILVDGAVHGSLSRDDRSGAAVSHGHPVPQNR